LVRILFYLPSLTNTNNIEDCGNLKTDKILARRLYPSHYNGNGFGEEYIFNSGFLRNTNAFNLLETTDINEVESYGLDFNVGIVIV
jgi:hypothetical protein